MERTQVKDSGKLMEDIGIPYKNRQFDNHDVYGRHENQSPDPKD